jgi:hypothetical protein
MDVLDVGSESGASNSHRAANANTCSGQVRVIRSYVNSPDWRAQRTDAVEKGLSPRHNAVFSISNLNAQKGAF